MRKVWWPRDALELPDRRAPRKRSTAVHYIDRAADFHGSTDRSCPGGSEHAELLVVYQPDGDRCDEVAVPPLVVEGRNEIRLSETLRELGGDPAADVNAAAREEGERDIPGNSAVAGDEQIER